MEHDIRRWQAIGVAVSNTQYLDQPRPAARPSINAPLRESPMTTAGSTRCFSATADNGLTNPDASKLSFYSRELPAGRAWARAQQALARALASSA